MSRFPNLPWATAAGLSIVLLGCGGSEVQPSRSAAAGVRIDGCVVDQYYVPHEGVPVRVLAADGRTLAQATSGRLGEFMVEVPPGLAAAMAVDRVDGERLQMPAADRDRVLESCLVARAEP